MAPPAPPRAPCRPSAGAVCRCAPSLPPASLSPASRRWRLQGRAALARPWGAGVGDGSSEGAPAPEAPSPGAVEQVLSLVFRAINWDPETLCTAASISRRLRAIAERVLWRDLCISLAPQMVASLTTAAAGGAAPPPGRIGGGWPAMAKLLSFCCGATSAAPAPVPGHLTRVSRFSKTSGRSFLPRRCRGDLLYVSDPCEHAVPSAADDLSAYHGIFRWFMRSRTWACLLRRQAALDPRVRCPYCGARVWSRLVPRGAARRMGSDEGRLQYYVCVSGPVHDTC